MTCVSLWIAIVSSSFSQHLYSLFLLLWGSFAYFAPNLPYVWNTEAVSSLRAMIAVFFQAVHTSKLMLEEIYMWPSSKWKLYPRMNHSISFTSRGVPTNYHIVTSIDIPRLISLCMLVSFLSSQSPAGWSRRPDWIKLAYHLNELKCFWLDCIGTIQIWVNWTELKWIQYQSTYQKLQMSKYRHKKF